MRVSGRVAGWRLSWCRALLRKERGRCEGERETQYLAEGTQCDNGRGKAQFHWALHFEVDRQVSAVEGFRATYFGSMRVSIERMRRGWGERTRVDCRLWNFGRKLEFDERSEDGAALMI